MVDLSSIFVGFKKKSNYNKKKSLEEAIIYALKQKSVRATLAILALFNVLE